MVIRGNADLLMVSDNDERDCGKDDQIEEPLTIQIGGQRFAGPRSDRPSVAVFPVDPARFFLRTEHREILSVSRINSE